MSRLRFIAVTATGFDCVDIEAAGKCGIAVSNVPVYGTDSAENIKAFLDGKAQNVVNAMHLAPG